MGAQKDNPKQSSRDKEWARKTLKDQSEEGRGGRGKSKNMNEHRECVYPKETCSKEYMGKGRTARTQQSRKRLREQGWVKVIGEYKKINCNENNLPRKVYPSNKQREEGKPRRT